MKEHDVTWLYGPLQTGIQKFGKASPISTSRLSRTDSFVTKKSILKKRSLSEAMLSRSISSSTLLQQAVDSLVSQKGPQGHRPIVGPRGFSDFDRSECLPSVPCETPAAMLSTSPSSGLRTPSEKRHIHFSEKVEQCIAINKDVDEVNEELEDSIDSDEESDDGVLMMKSEKGKERKLGSRNSTPRASFSEGEKQRTIAMLPSTFLRGDTPEPPEDMPLRHTLFPPSSPLSKSPSQDTLKPPKSNSTSTDISIEDEDEEMELKGLRRTPSGMFMPYDENEEDFTNTGVLGKIIDTINTAKDIAHVVWNVGWRR
jgi:hypothetical protein